MTHFTPELLPWDDEYIIQISKDVYKPFFGTTGSFSVLFARILGLSYAASLRYLQDYYNAKVTGKDGLYCVIRFDNERDCRRVCELLSTRWDQILRRL